MKYYFLPQYCLIETDVNVRRFVTPTEEQILGHRVIVATLNTSRILASLKLEKGKARTGIWKGEHRINGESGRNLNIIVY